MSKMPSKNIIFSQLSFGSQLNIIKNENQQSSLRFKNQQDHSNPNAKKLKNKALIVNYDEKTKKIQDATDEPSLGIIHEENQQISQTDMCES